MKVLFDPKHQVCLVLVGAQEANNDMEYEGVMVVRELEVPVCAPTSV